MGKLLHGKDIALDEGFDQKIGPPSRRRFPKSECLIGFQALLNLLYQLAEIYRTKKDDFESFPLKVFCNDLAAAGNNPGGDLWRPLRQLVNLVFGVVACREVGDEEAGKDDAPFEICDGRAHGLISLHFYAFFDQLGAK